MLPAFGSHITLIWLPTGIAVASLLRWGFPCWPGVAIGAFAVNLVDGLAWPAVLGIAAGNTAGSLLAASILRLSGFNTAFDRKRDFLLLAGAAALGMLVSASVGVAMLAMAGALAGSGLAAWLIWWAGDSMGVVAAAPLLLTFTRHQWRTIASRRGEFLIWIATTGLIVFAVFFVNTDAHRRLWAPSFLTLPMLAWAALRFGKIGTSLAIITLSAVAACGTATGRGPFSRVSPSEAAGVLWVYMATCAVLGWLITALHSAGVKATGIQNLLEQALSDVSLGVLLGDLDRKITYANAGFTHLTGYSEVQMLGQSCRILHGPETDPIVAEKLRGALQGDGYFDGEILNYRKDGTTFWNALQISPIHNERGELTGFLGIQRDITERKRAQQALLESEVKFRSLFENAGDAIFLMQGELFADCNVRTLEMFGCEARGQIVGHPPYKFSPKLQPNGRDSREFAIEKITAALTGQPQVFEWLHTRLDGTAFPAEVSLNTVILGGQVTLQAIVRDISERKRAEEEIRTLNATLERRVEERTGELQAVNQELEAFSYSVSHDLKTPLRAVEGFSHIVAKKYADQLDDEGREMLGMVSTGAQRMARLIDDLLIFSRIGRQPMALSPIDMHALAQEVFEGLAALEPRRDLRLRLRPLPSARGTEPMIRQVWANLIANAIKFTNRREVGEIEIGATEGSNPIYYIKDNGVGFDMRFVQRLFGVFQRLHSVDEFEGTGIGLALVQRIVQRHGGRIWAEAEVERGATFSFTLPDLEARS